MQSLALVCAGVAFLAPWRIADAESARTTAPNAQCSNSHRATITVAGHAQTSFSVTFHDSHFADYIDLAVQGCRMTVAPKVHVRTSNGTDHRLAATFINKPGAYAIHLAAKSKTLSDGGHTVQLVVSGPQANTAVIPVTIKHQYANLWWIVPIFAVAIIVGVWLAAVRAVASGDEAKLFAFKQVGTWLLHHPISAAAGVVAGLSMGWRTYEHNYVFTGTWWSLLGLGLKIGGAAAAAHVVGSLIGNQRKGGK